MIESNLNNTFPSEFPNELKSLILDRKDLLEKGFNKVENERKLVLWIILHGVKEYKNLLNTRNKENEIIKWLSQNSSDDKYNSLSKIILGLWDSKKSIRTRFPNPNNDNNFSDWIKYEFKNLKLEIRNSSIAKNESGI